MRAFRVWGVLFSSVLLGWVLSGCRSSSADIAAGAVHRAGTDRTFEFTYVARVPALPKAKQLRVWIPIPQADDHQDIEQLRIESPAPYEMHRGGEYGNRYVYLEVNAGAVAGPVEIRMSFVAKRREHKVTLPPAPQVGLSASWMDDARLERFLQPDRLVPLDGVIAALAGQEVDRNGSALEKARQVYDYVVRTMRYDKSGEGWGRGDAVFACDSKRGNCTDFHSVLIGMLRVAGVPARFEIGFPLPADKVEGEIPGYHCWASFYVEGLGWVPVDASEAWKQPEKRDYFFGAHDEHRVLFTLGRDITLEPQQAGEPLNYFIYPHVEADGKKVEVETKFFFRDVRSLN